MRDTFCTDSGILLVDHISPQVYRSYIDDRPRGIVRVIAEEGEHEMESVCGNIMYIVNVYIYSSKQRCISSCFKIIETCDRFGAPGVLMVGPV